MQGEHDACGQVWNPEVDGVVPGQEKGVVLSLGGLGVLVLAGHVSAVELWVQYTGLERSISSVYR